MAEQYLVLDIGGTFIKYAIMDREAQFVEQGKVPAVTDSEDGTLAALASVRDAVAAYDYEGVAISMPGRIDTAAGIAHTGGISARPETTQIIADAVDAIFEPNLDFLPFGKPEIVTCTFGNEANLIGALAFHLRK